MRWSARNWATTMGLVVASVRIMPLRRKWGSMSVRGHLTLDSALLGLPRDLGEYVIVHELVHLLAPNHGKVFKAFLKSYLPDWEDRHERLQRFARPDHSSL